MENWDSHIRWDKGMDGQSDTYQSFMTNEIGRLDTNLGLSLVFEISRKYTLRKVGVQNDSLELLQKGGVQSPIFPSLLVICFMAMLSSNG